MKSGLLLKLAGCALAAVGGLNAGTIFQAGTARGNVLETPFFELGTGFANPSPAGCFQFLGVQATVGSSEGPNWGAGLDLADVLEADHFIYAEPGPSTLDDPAVAEPLTALFLTGGMLVLGVRYRRAAELTPSSQIAIRS